MTSRTTLTKAVSRSAGILPLVDLAYQGFGDGLDKDASGVRLFARRLPELLVAFSCSKNFGLYCERTGCALALTDNARSAGLTAECSPSAPMRQIEGLHEGRISGSS